MIWPFIALGAVAFLGLIIAWRIRIRRIEAARRFDQREAADYSSELSEHLESVDAAKLDSDESRELKSTLENVLGPFSPPSEETEYRSRWGKVRSEEGINVREILKEIWYSFDPAGRHEPSGERWAFFDSDGWTFVLTKEFSKSIQCIDRKIQGRILEAIDELTADPITPRGDTIKPLVNDMKGLWRYRIGDYRLIYAPIEREHKLILLKFTARGEAYA